MLDLLFIVLTLMFFAAAIGYIAAWRALYRLARGQPSWTKTPRTDETQAAGRHRQRPRASLSPRPDRSS